MYVLLTGNISNAGDFLIKERAVRLFEQLRPERKIVTFDRWKCLTKQQLETVNSSRALILCGGPSYQRNFYPGIYPLTRNLSKIKVPIIAFGLGWKGLPGKWQDTHKYNFTQKSFRLLNRIENSGYKSSCRDYLTLNMLMHKGYRNHIMTGCPVWYSLEHIGKALTVPEQIKKVVFSTGVSFVGSERVLSSVINLLLKLKEIFSDKLICAFHHPLEQNAYRKTGRHRRFLNEHKKLAEILKKKSIEWTDISKSADNLSAFYDQADLHIGFRVHAHLYMLSIRKPSILLIEDGRGYGVANSLGGISLAAAGAGSSIAAKIMHQLRIKARYSPIKGLTEDLINNLSYEIENGFPRNKYVPCVIDEHFEIMKNFISQLP